MSHSMKQKFAVIAVIVLVAAAAFAPVSTSAASAAIERAKDECLVGEQTDGYLGVVSGQQIDLALQRELRDTNQQRKTYYAEIARRNGVPVEATAKIAGEKLVNQAEPGECIRDQAGNWRKV